MTSQTPIFAPSNADNLDTAFEMIARLIRSRLGGEDIAPDGTVGLEYFDDNSPLGNFLRDREPPFAEYITLLLALAPHARPTLIDAEIRAILDKGGDFPEVGGLRDPDSRTFLPTGQTVAFLLAGDDLEGRFVVQRILSPDHWFAREGILRLEPAKDGAPALSGRLILARDWVDRLTLGETSAPPFSAEFPARRIETQLGWDDLVLPAGTQAHLSEILDWVQHFGTLSADWGLKARLRPGYRALFHGASGTGKTFAATLIGKTTGREVFRVDLSAVVSKYIGETEKNLANLFTIAQDRNWILFFDEADALFGKRTNVKDSHDRYANQEVSYLLQRIEECDALCILASNLRANIDDAFLRRFNAVIRFPEPGAAERQSIWRRALPLEHLSDEVIDLVCPYELTGGSIVNVAQFAAINALTRGEREVGLQDLELGIRREIEKEGKVFRSLNAS